MAEPRSLSSIFQSVAHAAALDRSFTNFDLGLSPEVLSDMQALRVDHGAEYDSFGQLDVLRDETARFLESLGNTPELSGRAADAIDRMVKDSIAAVGAETAWLTLRASTPTNAFDIPRWHTDGWYLDDGRTEQKKILYTLKGAGTLLNDLPQAQRDPFFELQRSFENDTPESRRTVEKLIDPIDTQVPVIGQGTIFVVGDKDRSAVHSEPPIHSERLFLSIVPGSKAQIAELRARWDNPPLTTYSPPAPGPK